MVQTERGDKSVMEVRFSSLVVSFFHILNERPYDALIELIWENERHPNIEKEYSYYKNSLFRNLKATPIEEERRKQILNFCLYIRDVVLKEIITSENWDEMYLSAKMKIEKYKLNWKNAVEKHFQTKNKRKYIWKELEEQDKTIDKEEFVESRISKIREWASDEATLLSDFYYVEDLQKNQINLILKTEPLYVVLKEVFNNEDDGLAEILNQFKNKASKKKKKGGQVPDLVLHDGIFRPHPIQVTEDDPYVIDEGTNFVLTYDDLEGKLKISVPKTVHVPELNNTFDYTTDVIHHGKFELATLTAILQIGRDQIKTGNKITFTFAQICELFNQPVSTYMYQRIAQAIFYLKINLYSVKLPGDYERIFNIISAVEKPIYNSNREKEWTIEIDPVLREQILQSHYTELFAEDIAAFNYELTPILFKLLLIDKGQDPYLEVKEYHLNELSKRCFLTGKPNIRKKKFINSFTEIEQMENSPITGFEARRDNTLFKVYFKKVYEALEHKSPSKMMERV